MAYKFDLGFKEKHRPMAGSHKKNSSQSPFGVLFFFILLLVFPGCAGWQYPFSQPPGTIEYQQQRAIIHDIYPVPYGPDMTGTRPKSFEKPRPEPINSKLKLGPAWEVIPART
ncbi:MAG: hypothetical protein MPJ24_07850 [Pirellulaceae bacterium]|nr:hypothetical protein [Pirellulaceae bacterium]